MQTYKSPHLEKHKSHRAAWLRAAVLGMNDGIVSNASLMLGVLAASHNDSAILTAGIAGLVAGALSMAAGEYVSVSSQRDSEKADIAIERRSIAANPKKELAELAWIYEQRGLEPSLAKQVAVQLHEHDAVGAHARDELNIDHEDLANPTQAAIASAIAFSLGSSIPILAALIAPASGGMIIAALSLVGLAVSGAVGAYIGGGHRLIASLRVFVGGGIAMAITYFIGHLIGGGV
ncbi:MAG: Membrane protein [Candidatus Saccharibacteria bacterium]|nr:Membrane protein [Candidatus Saccharibacteria bacterium]